MWALQKKKNAQRPIFYRNNLIINIQKKKKARNRYCRKFANGLFAYSFVI